MPFNILPGLMKIKSVVSHIVFFCLGLFAGLWIATNLQAPKEEPGKSSPKTPGMISLVDTIPTGAKSRAKEGVNRDAAARENDRDPSGTRTGSREQETGRLEAHLDTPRRWPVLLFHTLEGVNAVLTTTWRGGKMYYQFIIGPDEETLRNAGRQRNIRLDGFTFELFDEDGFRLTTIHVPLYRMETALDKRGNNKGLKANEAVNMTRKDYLEAESWKVKPVY